MTTQRIIKNIMWKALLPTCFLLLNAGIALASPPPGTLIENIADVDYQDPGGAAFSKQSNAVIIPLAAGPSLTISKTGFPDPVGSGGEITYQITCQNEGNSRATGLIITDTIPEHTEYISGSASQNGIYDENTRELTWQFYSLNPASSQLVEFKVKVDPGLSLGTTIFNTVSVFCNEGVSDQDYLSMNVGLAPNLGISKAIEKIEPDESLTEGSYITYRIEFSNAGNQTATGLTLYDPIPENTQFSNATNGGSVAGNDVVWFLDDLPPNSTTSVKVTFEIIANPPEAILVANSAMLVCAQGFVAISNEVIGYLYLTIGLISDPQGNPVNWEENNKATAFLQDSSGNTVSGPKRVNTEGYFILPVPGQGTYELIIQFRSLISGIELRSSRQLNVTEGGGLFILEREVVQGSAVKRGALGELKYLPLNTPVTLINIDTQDSYQEKIIDNYGNFVFLEDLPPGNYLVKTEHPEYPGVFVASNLSILEEGQAVTQGDIFIDPSGVVFDSISYDRIAGATISLVDPDTKIPISLPPFSGTGAWPNVNNSNPFTSNIQGLYSFLLSTEQVGTLDDPAIYHLQVESPPGYMDRELEVQVAQEQDKISSLLITVRSLDGMPIAKAGSLETTWETVTLQGILSLAPNIPLFITAPAPCLQLEKKAKRKVVYLGDIAHYTLTLTNQDTQFAIDNIWIEDHLPPGMKYIPGSTFREGNVCEEPGQDSKGNLSWFIPRILPEEQIQLSYALKVGPNACKGDGLNIAQAAGQSLNQIITSNQAKFQIKIKEGIFTSKGIVIGKVFADKNGDGFQNYIDEETSPTEEVGIPGVHLYLENGVRVITDEYGKFSIFGLEPGTHVLRLDESTLPSSFNSNSGFRKIKPGFPSQFLDIKAGQIYQADFPIISETSCSSLISSTKSASNSSIEKFTCRAVMNPGEPTLEEQILGLTPEPAFLYPEDGQIMTMGHSNVQIKFPLGAKVILQINGEVINEKRVGTKVTNTANQTAIYEFISLRLNPEENTLKMQIKDQFGNVRATKSIKVYRIGYPHSITLSFEKEEIPADGITKTLVDMELRDKRGYLVPGSGIVTVEASAGQIEGEDIDPWTSGIQIRCQDGQAQFYLISDRKVGPATIAVHFETITQSKIVYFIPHMRAPLLVGVGELTLGYGHTKGDYLAFNYQLPEKEGFFHQEKLSFFFKGKVGEDKVLTLGYDSKNKDKEGLFETLDSTDEQEGYSVYGDSSKIEYETQSKSNIYVKLEDRHSSILWGDYKIDISQMKLSKYRRSFNGFLAQGKNDSNEANLFISPVSYALYKDEIRGQGIFGYYYLDKAPILQGSEQVSVEVRDKDHPDEILSQRKMQKDKDYEIDYDLGSLMFKEPIPYEDAQGNPVYIVVDYYIEGGTRNNLTIGVSVAGQITDKIKIQAHVIKEETTDTEFLMLGAMSTLSLGYQTKVLLEAAKTKSTSKMENAQ